MPLLQFIVVAWLPGAVVFRLPWLSRERRASLPAAERLYWAVTISAAVSLALVLALAAAHRYSFRRLVIADLAIAAGLALASRFDLRLGPTARPAGPAAGVALAIALF